MDCNPLILKRTDGSESAQKHPNLSFSTLIEPGFYAERRGQITEEVNVQFLENRHPSGLGSL
jgi:hypothetical protein